MEAQNSGVKGGLLSGYLSKSWTGAMLMWSQAEEWCHRGIDLCSVT